MMNVRGVVCAQSRWVHLNFILEHLANYYYFKRLPTIDNRLHKWHVINRRRDVYRERRWANTMVVSLLHIMVFFVSSRLASTLVKISATATPNERRDNWKRLIYARSCLSRPRAILANVLKRVECLSTILRYVIFDWNSIHFYANF